MDFENLAIINPEKQLVKAALWCTRIGKSVPFAVTNTRSAAEVGASVVEETQGEVDPSPCYCGLVR